MFDVCLLIAAGSHICTSTRFQLSVAERKDKNWTFNTFIFVFYAERLPVKRRTTCCMAAAMNEHITENSGGTYAAIEFHKFRKCNIAHTAPKESLQNRLREKGVHVQLRSLAKWPFTGISFQIFIRIEKNLLLTRDIKSFRQRANDFRFCLNWITVSQFRLRPLNIYRWLGFIRSMNLLIEFDLATKLRPTCCDWLFPQHKWPRTSTNSIHTNWDYVVAGCCAGVHHVLYRTRN